MLELSGVAPLAHEDNGSLQEARSLPSYSIKSDADQQADYSWVYEGDSEDSVDTASTEGEEEEQLVESTLRNIIRQEIKNYLSSNSDASHTNYASGRTSHTAPPRAERQRPASLGMTFAGPGFM